MYNTKTTLAMIALTAFVAPELCHAQNPTRNYSQIKQLLAAGKAQEAVKLCNDTIAFLANPKSRVGSQFNYLLPFFYWELAAANEALGDYDAADKAYDTIMTEKKFREKKMIEAAAKNPGKSLDYRPFFTQAMFKRAVNAYNRAAGTEKKPGDPKFYPIALEQLEKYYQLLSRGAVSAQEKQLKLDAQICLLIIQSALFQAEPNFELAQKYLEISRKSRAHIPDEMVMSSLNSISRIAKANPQYLPWVDKIVSAAPEQYDLGTLRAGRYASMFLQQGADASNAVGKFLSEGKAADAIGAARTTLVMFSLVPDSKRTLDELGAQVKFMEKTTSKRLPDAGWQIAFNPQTQKQVLTLFENLKKDNMSLEAMSILGSAQLAHSFGSTRLAKAAYQVVTDQYPNYSTRGADGKVTPFHDKNRLQLMALHSTLGETEIAAAIEKSLGEAGGGAFSDDEKNNLLAGRAARLLNEGNFEGCIEAAAELEKAYENNKSHVNYTNALFFRLAALYRLERFEELAEAGEVFLKAEHTDGKLGAQLETQALFFMMSAYNKLGSVDAKYYDRGLELIRDYIVKYPSQDLTEHQGLLPRVYYCGVDTFAKRANTKEGEERARDLDEAYKYCMEIVKYWPEHDLSPISYLLAGNILINGEDEKRKVEGIELLINAANSGITANTADSKAIASNALYWLVSYSGEIPMPNETPEAAAKRIAGYYDEYWAKVDQPGDAYVLTMAYLTLKHATETGDLAKIEEASDRMQKLYVRESAQSAKTGIVNADLQNTFPSYVDLYFDTMKAQGKELSYADKIAFHRNFPGVDANDKIMRSIIDINEIGLMNEQLASISPEDAAAVSAQQEEISRAFREMLRKYKPADLSSYGNVELGNFLVSYVQDLPESRQSDRATAVGFFDHVINGRDLSLRGAAMLGKANALALATDANTRAQAQPLFQQVINMQDGDLSGGALLGLTRLQMAQADYAGAIASASEYTRSAANNEARLDMMMLLADAYAKSGDERNALLTYLNLYNQNRARVSYSAPACVASMELLWKRNNPSSGDRLANTFKPSDRWNAWNMGQTYVKWVVDGKIEEKMTPADRDAYRAVVRAVEQYDSDSSVQREDQQKREFDRAVNANN